MTTDELQTKIDKVIYQAWLLGQTYWQQADSDSYAQNKKADTTEANFQKLRATTSSPLSNFHHNKFSS